MKKILHIVTQLEPGGAQAAAFDLSETLLISGYESKVLFIYKKRDSFEGKEYDLIRDRKIKKSEAIKIIFELYKYIKNGRFDTVITHTHNANIIGQFLAFVVRVQNRIAVQHSLPSLYSKSLRILDKIWGVIGIYKKIIVVSESVQSQYRSWPKRYVSKIRVIHNGIKVSKKSYEIGQIRYLTSVGRLSQEKNHKFLIDVMKNIDELDLYIIGGGDMKKELSEYAELEGVANKVKFVGELPRYQVHEFIQNSIFLFPSVSEAAGLAMLEAMAIGLPVVASDILATREYLSDAGIILPFDSDIWAKEIVLLLKDRERIISISGRAKARAAQFSVEEMVRNYESVL